MTAYGTGSTANTHSGHLDVESGVLLCTALVIDLADLIPLDLVGLGLVYELPLSIVETLLLLRLGVPKRNSVLAGALDLIPIIDIIPWATLAVLDRRFGIQLPVITRLLNG